jgi:hypothetical protein
MRHILIPSAALLLVAAGAAMAAEELKSGLQVGDSAGFFNVRDITGPNKGSSLCYR